MAKKLSPLEQAIARRLAQKKQAERRKEEQKGAGSEPAPEAPFSTPARGSRPTGAATMSRRWRRFGRPPSRGMPRPSSGWANFAGMGRVCLPIMPRP